MTAADKCHVIIIKLVAVAVWRLFTDSVYTSETRHIIPFTPHWAPDM